MVSSYASWSFIRRECVPSELVASIDAGSESPVGEHSSALFAMAEWGGNDATVESDFRKLRASLMLIQI